MLLSVLVSQDMSGRTFISVLDLGDEGPNQELPPSVSSGIPAPVHPSSPTSAQLHVLASSVIRAADEPQSSSIITQNPLQPRTEPGLIEFHHFIFSIIKNLTKPCCYIYMLCT